MLYIATYGITYSQRIVATHFVCCHYNIFRPRHPRYDAETSSVCEIVSHTQQYELVVVLYADVLERWPRNPFNEFGLAKYEVVLSLVQLWYSGNIANLQAMDKFHVVVCNIAAWN